MDALRAATNVAASAASGAANAAVSSPQTSSNISTGSPLMNAMTYLLYSEAIMILLLSVPFYVPYRRRFMEWLHYSPSLWRIRVVIFCLNAFVCALLADTWLRLNHITTQINAVQSAPNGVPAVPYGGSPGAVGAAGGPLDVTGSPNALHDLYSASFRAQRDYYILSFILFCSAVLYQLHMLLMKVDRYRNERNTARTMVTPTKAGPSEPTIMESAISAASQLQEAAIDTVNVVKSKVTSSMEKSDDASTAPANAKLQNRKVYATEE